MNFSEIICFNFERGGGKYFLTLSCAGIRNDNIHHILIFSSHFVVICDFASYLEDYLMYEQYYLGL